MRTSPEKISANKIFKEEKETSWNAEKYLPEINNRMEEYRDRGHLDIFLKMAAAVKVLDSKAELKLKHEERQKIKLDIGKLRREGDWVGFSTQAMAMKIIEPEFNPDPERKYLLPAIKELGDYLENHRWRQASSLDMAIKVLYPEFKLDIRKYWQAMEKGLKDYRETEPTQIPLLFTQAMGMKIINPKSKHIRESDWLRYRQQLNEYRKPRDWLDYATLSMAGKILASKKIEIPPEGGLKVE
jgi:hypothetical protein